jgi:hypothetical protein
MAKKRISSVDLEWLILEELMQDHLGRCYLKGRAGDAANVVVSAVGHNLRRILAWLRELLCLLPAPAKAHAQSCFLTDDSGKELHPVRAARRCTEVEITPAAATIRWCP